MIHKPVQAITTGKNVTLFCQLAKNHDIVQVTWQKNQTNIATYSKASGATVLSNQRNIHLSPSNLTFSAITFNGVTFKDEGCYSCIFNTFPLGPISGKTCLKVYGKLYCFIVWIFNNCRSFHTSSITYSSFRTFKGCKK